MNIPETVATGHGNELAPPLTSAHVLVIDDEAAMCAALSGMLRAHGCQVVTAQSGEEAVERLQGQHFELAITDLVMPGMDGIQTIAALKEVDPDIEVIVLTGYAGTESAVAALKHGACDYLLKPINMPQLCAAVARALEKRRSNPSLSLYEASPTMLAALETQEPILAVLKSVQGTMRATGAGLVLVPPQGEGLQVKVSGSDGRLEEAAVKSLALRAMQARQPLHDPFSKADRPHSAEAGIPAGSILAFPLEVRGELLGALVLWREKDVMPFSALELRSGEILAAETAITLNNAHLCRELSRKAEELETAHSAVARAEANARAIIDTAQEAIIVFDKEGVVWDLNPKALEIFGRSREETVGRNLVDFAVPPRQLGHFREYVETTYRKGRHPADKVIEVVALRKNGAELPLEIQSTLIETPQGKLLSTFARDITERKRAEEALRDNEEKYRVLFESSRDAIMTLAPPEWRFTAGNPAAIKLYGARGEREFVAAAPWTLSPEYQPDGELSSVKAPRMIATAMERGSHFFEWTHKKFNGEEFFATVSLTRMIFGGQTLLQATVRDITERKHAEERTRIQTAALESAANGIVIAGQDGRVLWVNPAFTRLTGYPGAEVLGQTMRVLNSGQQDANFYQRLWQTILAGGVWRGVLVNRRKDGSLYTDETTITPLRGAGGAVTHFIAVKQDVTERQRAARALEERTTYLNTLIDTSPVSIVVLDTEGCVQMSNPTFERLFLYSRQELQGVNLDELIIPSELVSEAQAFNEECLRGASVHATTRRRRKDGTLVDVEIYRVPLVMEGQPRGTLALFQDITERKRAEEALRASEERYRDLFENASDLVFSIDLEAHRLSSLNRVAEQTIGYTREEATQTNLRQLVDPRYWQRVEQAGARLLAGDSAVTLELEVMAKDGRRVMLEVKPRVICKNGKPVGVQGIGRDITGREAAEVELRHAQKLESVGRLASGIAHEINTPIQFVGDNTRFLQESFGGLQTLISKYQELRDAAASGTVTPDLLAEVVRAEEQSDCAYLLEEIPRALTQTLDGVSRVATIVRAMKDFAHPESKEKAAADLNKALLSTLTVARNELKYVADVETHFGELPLVVCNISDLNQVFLNLLVNAAHAIGEVVKGTGKKGKIRVRTVAEGKTVLISIADTGCGIPEGTRNRIFDPFFTTKEVGQGTGQGLAIARSVVVERHKGSLTFESEVGKGTTFCIRLPVETGEHFEEAMVP